MRSALEGSKEEVPGDVDGAMDQGGREDRPRLAPCPAVEEAGDRSQDDVAPIGKDHVGDVRKAKNNFFFQAEDGIRDRNVTGVQTCALPIYRLCAGWNPAGGTFVC